jgi:cell division inhibitor SepF
MAERLKRAAAWLGLVTDDRYADYDDADDTEHTESISREELVGHGSSVMPAQGRQGAQSASGQSGHGPSSAPSAAGQSPSHPSASVTPLETRRPAAPPVHQPTPSTSRAADMSRIVTVHPRTYNEARTIGEHFRDGVPVIMNLSEMEDVDAKRLVDFAAGLIFGLRGTIERVTSKVFLLSPQNVNVTAEDKERIAGGFFNQS